METLPIKARKFDWDSLWGKGGNAYNERRGLIKQAESVAVTDPLVSKALDYIWQTLQAMDKDHWTRPELEPIFRLLYSHLRNSTTAFVQLDQPTGTVSLADAKKYFETTLESALSKINFPVSS